MNQSTLLYFIVLFVIVVNNSNDAGAVESLIKQLYFATNCNTRR